MQSRAASEKWKKLSSKAYRPPSRNKISTAPLPVPTTSPATQERPQVEELTPPPMESFTPVGSPQQTAASAFEPVPDIGNDVRPQPVSHPAQPQTALALGNHSSQPEFATTMGEANRPVPEDLLRSLQQVRSATDGGLYGQAVYPNSHKKRKMSRTAAEDEFAAFAGDGEMAGIDDNLGELI